MLNGTSFVLGLKKYTIMKRIFITALALSSMCASFAQTQKGNVLIGADITNIGINFQKDNTQFSLNINPKYGKFVRDNLAVGGEVNLGLNTQKGATSFNYGVGIFARKYTGSAVTNLARTAKWFVEANTGIYGINITGTNLVKTSTNGVGFGLGPGYSYFISENIALEALAKYNFTAGFGNSSTNSNINLGLGFQIYLPGNRVKQLVAQPLK